MENSTKKNIQGDRSQMRGQGMPDGRGSPSGAAQQPGGTSVAVQDTPSGSDAVNLSKRELLIYQSGQSFGAAQALRQVAEQVNKLSQTINAQAAAQAAAGQELLDRALGSSPKNSGGQQSGKLGRRFVKAVGALVGVDDSE